MNDGSSSEVFIFVYSESFLSETYFGEPVKFALPAPPHPERTDIYNRLKLNVVLVSA